MGHRPSLPSAVPLATGGLLVILWIAGAGGDFFFAAALGLAYAAGLLLWMGRDLVAEWPGSRPGTIWPDQAVIILTAWYLLAAVLAASPARAAAGGLAALVLLLLYFLGRYLGALWLPGREAAGWGALVGAAALLAGLGLVLHALGLTPATGFPGAPPLTGLGDLIIPPPSGYLTGPGAPGGLAATGRLAAVLFYPNAAGALFLAGLMGTVWSAARAWKRTGGQPAGPCPLCRGLGATAGSLTLAGFLLLAGLLLSFSRGAWILWPVGLLALGLLLPREEALPTVLAGGLVWALGMAFLVAYLPLLAIGGPAAGLATIIAGGVLAWLAGERLGPRLGEWAARSDRPWLPPAIVAALVAATALAGFLLPRGAALRLAWPLVAGPEAAAWLGRLRDGAAAMLGRPLVGTGPGGWTVAGATFRQGSYVSLEPQGFFLKVGVEAGIPGLLLVLVLTVGALVALAPLVRGRRSGGLTAAYVAFGLLVVHGLLDYAVGYPPLAAYFFLLLGLTWGLGVRAALGPPRKPLAGPAEGRWWWLVAGLLVGILVLAAVGVTGRALEAVGEARLAAGRPAPARVVFGLASRLNPLSAGAFWGLARAHLVEADPGDLGEVIPVIASAGQAMRLDPGNPAYQSLGGQITVRHGFPDIGLRALGRARELDPVAQDHWENLVWGHVQAGVGYDAAGDRTRGEAAYARALDWAAATQAYFGPLRQGRVDLALGIAHLRLGQFSAAREAFVRALADPRTAGPAGEWLEALGD
ncbi:MAG: hypothetical protein RDU89_11600 [bacterium]|nr:hypothetical protein [bacterium]